MNISKQEVDALNLLVDIQITPEDYEPKVNKVLEDYKKRANVPGFRPGKVPMGLIKKQYGKAVLIDEINKILQDSVYNYINEEKLNILGNPLPVEQNDIDFVIGGTFDFQFELGLSPEFEVSISKKNKIEAVKIVAEDSDVDTYMEDIRSRYGKMVNPEKPEATDTFHGSLTEVDESGAAVEGGIAKEDVQFQGTALRTKKAQGELCKLENGAAYLVEAAKSFEKEFNLAGLLGVTDAQLEASTGHFQFTLKNVSRMEVAELNQEFFDKIYGEGVVSSEEEMRARIKEEAERAYLNEADQYFLNNVSKYLLEKTSFDLPETFLKKWMRTAGEEPLTEEQVETDWPKTLRGLRWQLIENQVIKMSEITVTHDELMEHTMDLVRAQFQQYGQAALEDEMIKSIAEGALKNQEEAQRINDQVYNQKLLAFYKDSFKVDEKEMGYEAFIKKATSEVEVNF